MKQWDKTEKDSFWTLRRKLLPLRVDNFWNNNYIKYESSGDRKKPISNRML